MLAPLTVVDSGAEQSKY